MDVGGLRVNRARRDRGGATCDKQILDIYDSRRIACKFPTNDDVEQGSAQITARSHEICGGNFPNALLVTTKWKHVCTHKHVLCVRCKVAKLAKALL